MRESDLGWVFSKIGTPSALGVRRKERERERERERESAGTVV